MAGFGNRLVARRLPDPLPILAGALAVVCGFAIALAPPDLAWVPPLAVVLLGILAVTIISPQLALVGLVLAAFLAPPLGPPSLGVTLFDVIGLGALISVILRRARGPARRGAIRSSLPLLLLPAAALLSLPALWSESPELLLPSVLRIGRLCVPVAAYLIARDHVPAGTAPRLVRLVAAAAGLGAGFAILAFVFQPALPWNRADQFIYAFGAEQYRAQGLIGEAASLGSLLLLSLALLLCAPSRVVPARLRVPSVLAILLASVLTFSRSVVLGLVVVVLGSMLARKKRRVEIAFLIGAVVVVATTVPLLRDTLGLRVEQTLAEDLGVVTTGRTSVWSRVVDATAAEPYFLPFGHGYKTLQYEGGITGVEGIAGDNGFVTALYETGLAGLLAGFVLLLVTWRRGGRARRLLDPTLAGVGSAMLVWAGVEVLLMMTGDVLTFFRTLGVWFAFLGLLSSSPVPAQTGHPDD